MRELRVGAAGPAGGRWKADLVGRERCLERALEILARWNVAAAFGADGADGRVVRERWCGLVRRRVGVREAAAHGAACADLKVADLTRGVGERSELRADGLVVRDIAMRRERADHDRPVGLG